MGTLNRVVNIVILVLAVVAVVFGSLLFKKREELRSRGDKMAEAISKVAGTLDSNSETAYQKSLVHTRLELDLKKDPANADKNAKMSLYHDNYANLESLLSQFRKQAQELVIQRDILGTTLKDIADTLEIPENFAQSQFQSIMTYDETKGKLVGYVRKVNDRDNALVDQIARSAGVIGFNVQREALRNLDDFATPLGEFGSRVESLKRRSDAYANHIRALCRVLEVTAPAIDGEDYASALSNVETAVRGVKDEFERTKTELAETKRQLEDTRDQLRQVEEKFAQAERKIADLQKKLDEIFRPGGSEEEPGTGATMFVRKLRGTVIDVNRKWDFVVIDLGSDTKMQITRGNKVQEIAAPLPANSIMTASRGDSYLGKVKIIRVNPNCAIADILPDERKGDIQIGDQVFFGDDAFTEIAQ